MVCYIYIYIMMENNIIKTNKVLIVEDNLINQRLYQRLFEKRGFITLTADNGREAITIYLTNQDIDLIMMDIQMPVLDGIETTRAIRTIETKNGTSARVPIIALTAYTMKDDEYFSAGCTDYITKPINGFMLDSIIDKYLKKAD